MEEQSPTPPIPRPGSSIMTDCGQGLNSAPELLPLWTTSTDRSLKREDSRVLAADLQHALNNVDVCPQPFQEDLHQYIAIRDIQPSYHENSPPQFFQYPIYQRTPSYVSYQSQPFGPLSPTPTTTSESPAMIPLRQSYIWPTIQEVRGAFDGRRGSPYCAVSPEDEEDEELCDKPYARLIYDALMQAPGHRMMLREIYDWFQLHTTKPADSGTNGWQNSIRHNLSMNQAFENDKSELGNAAGQKQKVNSVWVLTENAIKNGVQSTTRFRKMGSGKRMNNNRIPAPLRQRSGAKGGKAARRAAQLRKKEHLLHLGHHASSSLGNPQPSLYDYEGSSYDGTDLSDAFSGFDPATPLPDFSFGSEPEYQNSGYGAESTKLQMHRPSAPAPACVGDPDQSRHDYGWQSASDLALEDMLKVHHNFTASNLST